MFFLSIRKYVLHFWDKIIYNEHIERMYGKVENMKRYEIESTYCSASCSDRFEFIYDNYSVFVNILKSQKFCFIYMLESMMMYSYWESYCQKYNTSNRKDLINRISECMDKGETLDFLIDDGTLPDDVLYSYRNYLAMRIDFRIFSNALNGVSGTDGELLRRYISKEINLSDIATERTISYETAKGKIRDLKKLLKERTLRYFREEKAS